MVKARRRRKFLVILDLQNADLQGEIAKKTFKRPPNFQNLTEILRDPFFSQNLAEILRDPLKISSISARFGS